MNTRKVSPMARFVLPLLIIIVTTMLATSSPVLAQTNAYAISGHLQVWMRDRSGSVVLQNGSWRWPDEPETMKYVFKDGKYLLYDAEHNWWASGLTVSYNGVWVAIVDENIWQLQAPDELPPPTAVPTAHPTPPTEHFIVIPPGQAVAVNHAELGTIYFTAFTCNKPQVYEGPRPLVDNKELGGTVCTTGRFQATRIIPDHVVYGEIRYGKTQYVLKYWGDTWR